MMSDHLTLFVVVLGSVATVFGFLGGIFAGYKRLPPTETLRANYTSLVANEPYESIPSLAYETDPDRLNSVRTEQDVTRKRSDLRGFIWRDEPYPESTGPTAWDEGASDDRFAGFSNLGRIDSITTEMEYGVESIAYLFLPESGNDDLLVYHQGHSEGFGKESATIEFFLSRGFAVLALSMPFRGMNNQPIVRLDDFGTIRLSDHDQLRYLETDDFSPLKYFVHPVLTSLNGTQKRHGFDQVAIAGISGGGWTAHIVSALDERITASYPIDGALPLFLRMLPPSNGVGDYETEHAELYRTCNHLELFTMGAYGEDRSQLQILNKYAWAGGNRYQVYEPHVQERVSQLGSGSFEVCVDVQRIHVGTQHHQISDQTRRRILSDLTENDHNAG